LARGHDKGVETPCWRFGRGATVMAVSVRREAGVTSQGRRSAGFVDQLLPSPRAHLVTSFTHASLFLNQIFVHVMLFHDQIS
jgi:hypothetical protein